jgi:hypothetical protein
VIIFSVVSLHFNGLKKDSEKLIGHVEGQTYRRTIFEAFIALNNSHCDFCD